MMRGWEWRVFTYQSSRLAYWLYLGVCILNCDGGISLLGCMNCSAEECRHDEGEKEIHDDDRLGDVAMDCCVDII